MSSALLATALPNPATVQPYLHRAAAQGCSSSPSAIDRCAVHQYAKRCPGEADLAEIQICGHLS